MGQKTFFPIFNSTHVIFNAFSRSLNESNLFIGCCCYAIFRRYLHARSVNLSSIFIIFVDFWTAPNCFILWRIQFITPLKPLLYVFCTRICSIFSYQFSVSIGISIAIVWCAVVCVSRIYLGMHSVAVSWWLRNNNNANEALVANEMDVFIEYLCIFSGCCGRYFIIDFNINTIDSGRQSPWPYHYGIEIFTVANDCHPGSADYLLSMLR